MQVISKYPHNLVKPSVAAPDEFCFAPDSWHLVRNRCHMTAKQEEIAELLLTNLGDKQIADRMGVKHSTIRTHIDALGERLSTAGKLGIVIRLVAASRTDVPYKDLNDRSRNH